MKIGITSFVYYNFPLDEALRRIAAAGFQGVDIWGGRPHAYRCDLDQADIHALQGLLADLGLALPSFIPAQFRYPTSLCSPSERIRGDSIAYIQDGIRLAAALGCNLISVCPGHSLHGQGTLRAWDQLRRSLQALCDFAADHGARLALEPADGYETDLVQTADQALRLLGEVARNNLGVVLDVGHCHVVGESPAEVVQRLGPLLFHVHVDDNFGQRDQHLVPGDGNIDFGPILAALVQAGYDGFLSAELGWDYTLDPDPAVARTAAYLQSFLSQWSPQ
jgi:protein FrlC